MAHLPRALLCLGLIAFPVASALASPCQQFTPELATLEGTLERQVFPGAPNFEDIQAGDEAESGFYLVLAEPACVKGNEDENDIGPDDDVRLVQLVLDQPDYDRLRPFLNQTITVRGSLFSAFTGHHHAPLLMEKVEMLDTVASTTVNCAELAEAAHDADLFNPPWGGTVAAAMDLFAAPDQACPDSQRSIPANADVSVDGGKGDWLMVRYSDGTDNGIAGWIPANLVQYDEAGTRAIAGEEEETERPSEEQVAALPKDVQTFISGYETCEHFSGEEPYDEERRQEIDQAVAEFCAPIDSQLDELGRKYKGNEVVTKALSSFDRISYTPAE